MEAVRASLFKASGDLSSKLLDDHRRETDAFRKQTEENIRRTTEQLFLQHRGLFERVQSLQDHFTTVKTQADTVSRALLSPGGAGQLAEISLGNVLKHSGLVEGQDYILQCWLERPEGDGGLRPDAVVRLPGDHAIAIDSKASKWFQELAVSTEDAQEKHAESRLKSRMTQHLKDLEKRDYRQAIESASTPGQGAVRHATVLMYLPTEAALERVRRIDPEFMDRAWKRQILPVGPAGLLNTLIQAQTLIAQARQDENYQGILQEVRGLLTSVARLQGLSQEVGKGLHRALQKYNDLAGVFNGQIVRRVRKLDALGVAQSGQDAAAVLELYASSDPEAEVPSDAPALEDAA